MPPHRLGSSWKLWTRLGWKMLLAAVVLAVAYGRIRYGSLKMLVSMLLLTLRAALEHLQVWVTTQMVDGWAICMNVTRRSSRSRTSSPRRPRLQDCRRLKHDWSKPVIHA